jgi:hypothetical protein
MREIEKGLFVAEEPMPCRPEALTIYPYVLVSTLGRAEQEEAAARILSFSQRLGQWVGVSWKRLAEMMIAEFETMQKIEEARRHNWEEKGRVHEAMRSYHLLSMLTLGIYMLLRSKPTAQLKEEPREKLPFSGIYMFGPDHVATGIRELLETGMLRQMTESDGESTVDVFFPTPTLIERIMQVQKVSPTPA